MRAFGTFLLFALGLATGGFSGYWIAGLGGGSGAAVADLNAQIVTLSQSLAAAQERFATADMMIEGSTDVLAGYKQQIERLKTRIADAERIAIDAQATASQATADAGGIAVQAIPTNASDTQLRTELNNAFIQIRNLEAQLGAQSTQDASDTPDALGQAQERIDRLVAERESMLAQLTQLQFQLGQSTPSTLTLTDDLSGQ